STGTLAATRSGFCRTSVAATPDPGGIVGSTIQRLAAGTAPVTEASPPFAPSSRMAAATAAPPCATMTTPAFASEPASKDPTAPACSEVPAIADTDASEPGPSATTEI